MLNSKGEALLPISTQVRLKNFTFEANGRSRNPIGRIIGYDNSVCKEFTDYYIVESDGLQGYTHYTNAVPLSNTISV